MARRPLEERLLEKERELDRFETDCALPSECPLEVENEARRLLTLTPASLRGMTAIQCGEGAFTLLQFAFFLQKASNREQSRIKACERGRDFAALRGVDQVSGYGFEERMKKAVQQNDAATRLDGIRHDASLRKDRISFLDDKVKEMAHALMALQSTKRGRE